MIGDQARIIDLQPPTEATEFGPAAMEDLYAVLCKSPRARLRHVMGDQGDDALHDLFIQLVESIRQGAEIIDLRSYSLGATTLIIATHLRRKAKYHHLSLDDEDWDENSHPKAATTISEASEKRQSPGQLELLERQARSRQFNAALRVLSPRQRSIIRRTLDGQKQQQICKEMGLSENACRNGKHIALTKLSQVIAKDRNAKPRLRLEPRHAA